MVLILTGRRQHAKKMWQKSRDESDDEGFTKIRSARKCASRKPKLVLSSDEDDLELFIVQKEEQGSFFRYLLPSS